MKTKNLTTFFTFTSLLLGLYTFGISRAEVSQVSTDVTSNTDVTTKKEKTAGYGFFEKTKNYGFFIGVGSQGTNYQIKDVTTTTENGRIIIESNEYIYPTTGNFVTIGYKIRPRVVFASINLEVGELGLRPLYFAEGRQKYDPNDYYISLQLTLGLQLTKNFAIYGIAGSRDVSMVPSFEIDDMTYGTSETVNFNSFFFGGGLEVELIPHIVLFTEYTYAPDKRGSKLRPSIKEDDNIISMDIDIRQLQTIKGGLKAYF